jgi:hypothetical protein
VVNGNAFTEFQNKSVQCHFPVLYRHGPPSAGLLDCKIHHLSGRVIRGKYLSPFGCCANHAVQRLHSVGGVDGLANLRRVFEDGAQVGPMCRPRFADLWIL